MVGIDYRIGMMGKIKSLLPERLRTALGREDRDGGWARRLPMVALEFLYVAVVLLAVDLSIDGGLALGPASVSVDEESLLVFVPAGVYLYALMGAGAYAATSLVFEPKESLAELKRLGYRILAALPLGAAVFLLATFVVGPDALGAEGASNGADGGSNGAGDGQVGGAPVLAGLAFIAGLYVKLTLRKLGDVAETVYNIGDVRTRSHEKLQKRHDALDRVRKAWRASASEGTTPGQLDGDARESLRTAETILDQEDATAAQLDRAIRLAEQSHQQFGDAVDGDDPES
jgi:hypothetical protein